MQHKEHQITGNYGPIILDKGQGLAANDIQAVTGATCEEAIDHKASLSIRFDPDGFDPDGLRPGIDY